MAYSASGPDGLLPHFDHDEPAIVVSAIGAKCGKTWLASGKWSCIKNTIWVRAVPDVATTEFLFHATRDPDKWPRRGAAQPFISQGDAKQIRVRIPSLNDQDRIGSILSAIDEVIAINERRIELLEDLARSLYREWFVHFRYPGHEKSKFKDSELGAIPAGWDVQPVGEVLEFIGGGTPSKRKDEFWDGGTVAWYTPSDLTSSAARYTRKSRSCITEKGLAGSSAKLFPEGSVLMTSRATLGKLAIARGDSTCNQGFIVILPNACFGTQFVYEWLASEAGRLEQIATGATFKEITKGAFKKFPILVPESSVLEAFSGHADPIGEQIADFESHNEALKETRDLLLPRLVTGKLDISDIDLGVLEPKEAA